MSTKCLITFLLRHQLSYYASVSERVSLTSPIIRLQASDADVGENGKVRFDLTGEGSLDFRIDSQTGELIWIHFWAYSFYLCNILGELFAVKELDRESTSHYKFISTASDGGGNTCVSQVWRLCIRMCLQAGILHVLLFLNKLVSVMLDMWLNYSLVAWCGCSLLNH